MPDNVDGENQKVDEPIESPKGGDTGDKGSDHPENVSWTQYVGIKEKLGKTEAKVVSLEEQLKTTVTTEEHGKVKTELEEANKKLGEYTEQAKAAQEQALKEMRETLTKRGVPEETVKGMSESELKTATALLGVVKPKPDMGGEGTGESPQSAKDKIRAGFAALHPED